MISQKPEGWQGEGSPALGPQISPLSLGRGENALSAELQTMRSAGARFPPLLAASEHETLEAWARRESKRRKEESLCIQYSFSLAGKRRLPPRGQRSHRGTHQPYSKLVGAAAFQPTPATKFKAAQVVTLLPDHRASSVVCLKGIFPRNKTLRPLFLGCLAARCCHVFMARAACGRWDPKWRQLWGCYTFVAQARVGFCYPASNRVACPLLGL